jgi:SAM-dependent methyltransferase
MNPKLQDLEEIAERTLQHYNQRAEAFWESTCGHDVSQNIAALLRHIRSGHPLTLLDFGCGPGRDLKVFADLGHVAIGLEGAPRFAEMARSHTGCEVWRQDFLKLDLPQSYFDGVFANATLFHVPSAELPRVLQEIHTCLKPGGILFTSIPRGNDEEGWRDGRYGVFHDPETWRAYGSAAGFIEIEHYYRPAGLPREMQPWFASVWRRQGRGSGTDLRRGERAAKVEL